MRSRTSAVRAIEMDALRGVHYSVRELSVPHTVGGVHPLKLC